MKPSANSASAIHIIDSTNGKPVRCRGATIVSASSRGLGWDGVVVEVGRTRDWVAEELACAGHLVVENMAERPLSVERKGVGGIRRVVTPPRGLWIAPALQPFTHRVCGSAKWAAVEVTPERAQRVLGRDIEPRQRYGVVDAQLAAIMRALSAEVTTHGTTGNLYAESLVIAFIHRLASISGIREDAIAPRGALIPPRLRLVVDRIEDAIGTAFSVDELAELAGLSPAHFAREFKRVMREPPHAFVTRRRLERAQQLLLVGRSISEVAGECGFYDQAHLSRLFKQRFGTTPGSFIRSIRGHTKPVPDSRRRKR